MEKRSLLDAKLQQQQRLLDLLEDLREDINLKYLTLAAMQDQTYDVRIALNEVLLQFCQAYYYENLYNCPYMPEFGGSLLDLLLKINSAAEDTFLLTVCGSIN